MKGINDGKTAERILALMSRKNYRPLKRRQLALLLGRAEEGKYEAFKLTLKQLVASGHVVKGRGNKYDLAERARTVVGRLVMRGSNYGFVRRGDGLGMVEIERGGVGGAMHGDTVEVEITEVQPGKPPRGRVVNIVSAGDRTAVGTIVETRYGLYFIPIRGGVFPEVPVVGDKKGLKHGDLVTVEFVRDRRKDFTARVVERLGDGAAYSSTLEAVLRAFEIPRAFPAEITAEAARAASEPLDLKGRKDFRPLPTVTIDPDDAKDYDDALSLERTPDGWRLYVHIADVSAAVKRGSPLDAEARKRGTSVYLPSFVVPMLPHQLSTDRCCLAPEEDRLAKTVVLDYDSDGVRRSAGVVRSVIRSNRRLTYREVQAFLDGKGTLDDGKLERLVSDLDGLASKLRSRRVEAGSLLIDMPEVKVILDESGSPVDLVSEYGDRSHHLVEECMLEANRAVAEIMLSKGIEAIHRIHEEPDPLALENLRAILHSFGIPVSSGQLRRADLADVMEAASGKPFSRVVNLSVLRSMKLARYSAEPLGHYALAFDKYLHFTSPIRRYPDLFVHQQLDIHLFGVEQPPESDEPVGEIALRCSDAERNAQECERSLVQLKTLEYLKRFRGREFDAVITGVKEFGVIVELVDFLVDGLIHVTDRNGEYYVMDAGGTRLQGDGGTVLRAGQPVRVVLHDVDIPRRKLELRFAGHVPATSEWDWGYDVERSRNRRSGARRRGNGSGGGRKSGGGNGRRSRKRKK